jgi:hypothetical protein
MKPTPKFIKFLKETREKSCNPFNIAWKCYLEGLSDSKISHEPIKKNDIWYCGNCEVGLLDEDDCWPRYEGEQIYCCKCGTKIKHVHMEQYIKKRLKK